MKRLMMATALSVAALVTPTWAQSPAEHESHHPADSTIRARSGKSGARLARHGRAGLHG